MGDCARKSQALFIEVKQPSSTSSSVRKCEDAPSVEIFLAPFSPIPSLDFGDVRLGQSRVGSLSCVNPGPKSLSVLIDKFPKEEKGFSLDFSSGAFHLKPQEAANLSIGWVPRAIGGMRETVSIKYGSLKTSLTLSGLCSDPSAEKSRKAFRRPVLKSIQTHSSSSSSSSSASKIFLPPNPVTSQPPGRSPPKRSIPLQARITPRKTQREVISWSPQPVHFMDGSFLRKGVGEESKLLETTTEKIPLPSWTGSASSLRKKTENSWTPVDEEFMRKHSVLHVAGNESLIPDESLSSESSKASLPRESLFILNEIESVKAKLQESGIKQSPVLIKKSSDVLSDIQTNLVCSPARSSEIIEQLQLSDINVCLDLSPQEEKPVSQKLKSPLGDLSFKLDLSLSPKKETAPKEFDLSINVNLDLSPPQASPQNETEVPKENSNIVKLSKQPEMDEISMMVAEHLSMEANPKEEMQQLKQGSNGKMDEISFLVAEHLNEKRPYHRLEDSKKCDFLREETIYETNLLECKESFLQTTINETSFVPIPEKGYCSTAVKDKSKELSSIMDALSEDRSSAFCRDLFGSKGSNDSQLEAPSTPPKTYKKRVSSDTYILSPEIKKPESKAIGESFTIALSPPKLSESVFKVPSKGLESSRIVKKDGKPKSVRPRISSSIPISTFSASKASPHKRGSPFKRRSLAPRSSSKSGQTLIKMAAASNPKIARVRHASSSSIARHPNLFAAKNLYYDERWIEKQRKGFTKWLNFLLTPEDGESKKTDGAKLWNAWSKGGLAPSKEDMSFRAYTLGKEMNSLRMSAMRLWQSPAIVKVIRQLEIEIEKKRLYVRDDRCLNKDLGIKQSFLSLLLNYNPLWLRIGLETLYGEVLQVSGNSDILGISRFIITRLLSNPSILEAYSHPTVPHLYKPGHEEALKKFTLKMFLRLIFFLDVAKNQKLIKHDPCLFCKDSDFKMSRDLLVEFSKKFLACEGDITKHLRSIGYDVTHKQSTLDEFDYAIVNFPSDLRCGVRLCRVMDLLTGQEITSKVRLPAHSRLQKIHNMSLAFEALKGSPAGLPRGIDHKEIVNGNVEKTLGLLWHIIFGLGLVGSLPESRWRSEIQGLRASLSTMSRVREPATLGLSFVEERENHPGGAEMSEPPTARFILTWARLVCAHYGIEVDNLTTAFSDGRALCFLIHHYMPRLLAQEEIMMNTTLSNAVTETDVTTSLSENKKINEELLQNEKRNFKIFLDKVNELGGVPILIRGSDMSNTIPDRKVTLTFLIYLASRLLLLREEVSAAIKIQSAWRRAIRRREKKKLKKKYSTTDL